MFDPDIVINVIFIDLRHGKMKFDRDRTILVRDRTTFA